MRAARPPARSRRAPSRPAHAPPKDKDCIVASGAQRAAWSAPRRSCPCGTVPEYLCRPNFGGCACEQLHNSTHLTAFRPLKRKNATVIAWRFTSKQHLIGCSSEPISSRRLIGPIADVFPCNLPCLRWISGNFLTTAGEQVATGVSPLVHLVRSLWTVAVALRPACATTELDIEQPLV